MWPVPWGCLEHLAQRKHHAHLCALLPSDTLLTLFPMLHKLWGWKSLLNTATYQWRGIPNKNHDNLPKRQGKSHYKSPLLTTPADQSVWPMSFILWWRCLYIQSIEWSAPVMKCLPTGQVQATEATAYTPCGGKTIEVKSAKYTHLYPQFKMVYIWLGVGSFEPKQTKTKRMGN